MAACYDVMMVPFTVSWICVRFFEIITVRMIRQCLFVKV